MFQEGEILLDPLHVRNNLGPKLGAAKAIGLQLYELAVHAPTVEALENLMRQFSPEMNAYLGRFDAPELYREPSGLQDLKTTT